MLFAKKADNAAVAEMLQQAASRLEGAIRSTINQEVGASFQRQEVRRYADRAKSDGCTQSTDQAPMTATQVAAPTISPQQIARYREIVAAHDADEDARKKRLAEMRRRECLDLAMRAGACVNDLARVSREIRAYLYPAEKN